SPRSPNWSHTIGALVLLMFHSIVFGDVTRTPGVPSTTCAVQRGRILPTSVRAATACAVAASALNTSTALAIQYDSYFTPRLSSMRRRSRCVLDAWAFSESTTNDPRADQLAMAGADVRSA